MDSRFRENERSVGLAWRATCRAHPDRTRQPKTVGRPEAAHPEPVRASALGVRGINPNSTRAQTNPKHLHPRAASGRGCSENGIGGAQNGGHPIELFAVAFRRPTLAFEPMQPPFSQEREGVGPSAPPPGSGRRAAAQHLYLGGLREPRVRGHARRVPPFVPADTTRHRPTEPARPLHALQPGRQALNPRGGRSGTAPSGLSDKGRIREVLGVGISWGRQEL